MTTLQHPINVPHRTGLVARFLDTSEPFSDYVPAAEPAEPVDPNAETVADVDVTNQVFGGKQLV